VNVSTKIYSRNEPRNKNWYISFPDAEPIPSFYIPNGPIVPSSRLGIALRYFAGGDPMDIMMSFGVSHTEVLNSVWYVVDSVLRLEEFSLAYPSDHVTQRRIAREFKAKSDANFDCCAGCIDGILIWINRPSATDCARSGCDSGKFFCGRKGKFGLNCQAVSDCRGRILDVSMVFPGSTSDCLAFEGSSLYGKLETTGFLAEGLCLFGDNAYLNSPYMATPYVGHVTEGYDAYNFHMSQLRIRVECAFGILTSRWGLLRRAMPKNMPLKKIIAIVNCLCRLHNYCIDRVDNEILPQTMADQWHSEFQGVVPLEERRGADVPIPRQLIGGGNHFDDSSRAIRRAHNRQYTGTVLPREKMRMHVEALGLRRPTRSNRR